jgi:RNA polymerase sigma factor (TIGR02999 family)
MQSPADRSLTALVQAAGRGDEAAAGQLLPLVYGELRAMARARMAYQRPGATLQTTALVHEAYLKLMGSGDPGWEERRHFFGAASQAMRQILVDQPRRKARPKHGGDRKRLDVDSTPVLIEPPTEDMLGLDEALGELEKIDPRKAQMVMLRYFTGLTMEETAELLGVSLATAERDWRYIKVWLSDRLQ